MAGRTRARTASRSPAGGRAAGSAGGASPRSRNGEPWYLSSAAVRGPLGGRASASGRVWPGPVNVTFKRPDKNTRGSSSQGFGEPGGGTVVDILSTPFLWVVVTIGLYGVAYWGSGKWIDRNAWRSSSN